MCYRVLSLVLVVSLLAPNASLVFGSHKRHLLHSGRSAAQFHLWKNLQLHQVVHPESSSSFAVLSTSIVTPSPIYFHISLSSTAFNGTPRVSLFSGARHLTVAPDYRFSSEQTSSSTGWPSVQPSSSLSSSWPLSSSVEAEKVTHSMFGPTSTRSSSANWSTSSLTAGPLVATVSMDVSVNSSQEIEEAIQVQKLDYADFTQISLVHQTFLLLYVLVMLSAIVGNLLVCYTVLSNKKMQTVVNCYIVNLAVCDFVVGAFVLPSKMLELLVPNSWYLLNDSICTAMFFFQTIVVFASVLTLVATCFERYFAIVHPLKSRMQQSKRRTCRILGAVWVLSCIASLPNFLSKPRALSMELTSPYGSMHRRTCIPNFPADFRFAYFTILFIAFYLIPLLLIAFTSFCIARSLLRTSVLRRQGSLLRQEVNRRKVGKMILIVVLSFTVSWTPYFMVSVITQFQKRNYMAEHSYYFSMLCINLFAFLHSSINPVIYATMSTRFRKGFMRILRLVMCCQETPIGSIAGQTSCHEPGTSSRGSLSVNGTINNGRFNQRSLNAFKLNALQWRQSIAQCEPTVDATMYAVHQVDQRASRQNGPKRRSFA